MVSFADQAFIKSVVTNFDIAAAALLVYDYLITVGDEITYMWPSAWNPGKVLFFLTRYLVFVDTSLVLVHQFQVLTPNQCGIIFRSIGWMLGIGVGIAEAILTMRTCVIWAGNKTVQYALITIFIVLWAPLLYFLNDALSSLVFTTPPNPGTPGCFLLTQKNILFAVFIIVMSYETIIMTLTVIKGVTHFRQASSPLVVVLYRDGILNYIWLFALSLVNVVVLLTAPHGYTTLLSALQRVLHSLLSSRILLHLREAVAAGREDFGMNAIGTSPNFSFARPRIQIERRTYLDTYTDPLPGDERRRYVGLETFEARAATTNTQTSGWTKEELEAERDDDF